MTRRHTIKGFAIAVYLQQRSLAHGVLSDFSSRSVNKNFRSDMLSDFNPLQYRHKNVHRYKFKKMLTAAALGMTVGKEWDGYEVATGGYIIIKRIGMYFAIICIMEVILKSI